MGICEQRTQLFNTSQSISKYFVTNTDQTTGLGHYVLLNDCKEFQTDA